MPNPRSLAGLLLAMTLASCTRSGAAPGARTPVRIAVGSAPGNISYLPVDLALARGYFREEGLDPTFEYSEGGTEAVTALLAGKVDFAAGSIDHVIKARIKGKELRMVSSFLGLSGLTVLVRTDLKDRIRSPADLRGRKIGITTTGSATHVLAMYLVGKAGIPRDQVEIIPVGGTSTFVAAMVQGQIDAGVASDPAAMQLMTEGKAVSLIDLATPEGNQELFGSPVYQFTGMLATPETIAARRELVQRVVNALSKASRFAATHPAAEVAAALPASAVKNAGLFQKSIEHSRRSLSPDGSISVDGIQNNLQAQIAFGTLDKASAVDVASLYDPSFVERAREQKP